MLKLERVDFSSVLSKVGELVDIDRGERIYWPGDPSSVVYIVESGRVKLAYLDESGKKLTLMMLNAGEIFGEMCIFGETRRRHLATAIEDTLLRSIDKTVFMGLIDENPAILQQMVQHFAARMCEFEKALESLAFRDIQARLSRQLLKLSDDYGVQTKEGTLIGIPVTHRELADMIRSSRENVTLALNRFQEEGILDKRRFRIVIRNKMELAKKTAHRWIDS